MTKNEKERLKELRKLRKQKILLKAETAELVELEVKYTKDLFNKACVVSLVTSVISFAVSLTVLLVKLMG